MRIQLLSVLVDDQEKAFLRDLKSSAKSTSPEFDALYKRFVGA